MAKEEKKERRRYEKPEVRRVTLQPEESLAAGCKTTMSSAPGGGTCESNSCFNFGS